MRSFDLFDTLLGRLHYHPTSIFELVEKHFPFPGFAFYRMAAEYQSDRTLPDIYRHLQQLAGISEEQAQALLQFELETELAQVFPIVENVNLVSEGDLIVSDTYYSTSQLEQILQKIGLTQKVHLYVGPRGKSSGKVWEQIQKEHAVSSHLGDCLHADVTMAARFGIPATHYLGSLFSSHEKKMVELGQGALACLMRALRLQNPYPPQSPEFLFWNEQCQCNVPMLVQASLFLNEFLQKQDKKRVLFTSRDGCLWIQVFRALYPQYESLYFHASRYTYKFPTPSYIEYVRTMYTGDAVIVDGHGKGASCESFFETHFCLEPIYLAMVNSGKKHHAVVRVGKTSEQIEKLNYDLCGTLYDVQGGEPMRCEPEYDLRFIRPMHACIAKCVELLARYSFTAFDQKVADWLIETLRSGLIFDQYVHHMSYHCHFLEGKKEHIHVPRLDL